MATRSRTSLQWLSVALIAVMAFVVAMNLAGGFTSDNRIALVEDSWRLSQGAASVAAEGGLARFLAEARAERGIYQLLHQLPLVLSYLVAGASEASTHFFPILFSVITVVLVYLLGRQLRDHATGLVAAFLWALLPMGIDAATAPLFTSFYVMCAVGALVAHLRGLAARSWWAHLFSGLAILLCLLAVPVLGLALLVFVAFGFGMARIPAPAARQRFAGRLLAGLAAALVVAELLSSLASLATWAFYTELLARREFLLLLPLIFFALAWGGTADWAAKRPHFLGLGLAFGLFLALKIWPPTQPFLAGNLDGLASLLVMLPLILLVALSLAGRYSADQTAVVVAGLCLIMLALAIGYRALPYESGRARDIRDLLEILAGLAFFSLLLMPWLLADPPHAAKGWTLSAVLALLVLGVAHYTVLGSDLRNALNRNTLVAAEQAAPQLGLRAVYACPDELATRLWYLQGFAQLAPNIASADENPYWNFPRNIERREQGVLIISANCPEEVSSIYDVRVPIEIGTRTDTWILLFNVFEE